MKHRPKVAAIVVAAGAGTRFGGRVPKQFLTLQGQPLVIHTLRRFEEAREVDEIVAVVPESFLADVEALIARFRLQKVGAVVAGGRRRQDSVANGMRGLALRASDIVLVHDGVRPFVDALAIQNVIAESRKHKAAVLAVQPKDTVRRSSSGVVFDRTLDRTALWLVQTPQAFTAGVLKKAIALATERGLTVTDEAALVERMGIKARIVRGSYDNIKVTTQEDLELAGLILARWDVPTST